MRKHKRYDMVMLRRHMDGIREFGASVIEKIKSFLNWLKTHAGKGARILIKALLRLIQAASACLAIKAGKDYKAAVSGMGSEDYKAEVEKARAKFIRAKRMVEKVGWDYINSGANNANIIGENYRSSKKRLEELENGKNRAKDALGLKLIISLSSALAAQLGIAAVNARKDSMAYLRRYRRNDGPIDFMKRKALAVIEKIKGLIEKFKNGSASENIRRILSLVIKIAVIIRSGRMAYQWVELLKYTRELKMKNEELRQKGKEFNELGFPSSLGERVAEVLEEENKRNLLISLLNTLANIVTFIIEWKIGGEINPDKA